MKYLLIISGCQKYLGIIHLIWLKYIVLWIYVEREILFVEIDIKASRMNSTNC